VVDRVGWSTANAGLIGRLLGDAGDPGAREKASGVRARAGASQVAPVLALLSTRVLGQYDPYSRRLLLVAPNILRTERALGVDPRDFRLWVCLHEQTHALQFATAPWLADHIEARALELVRGVSSQLP